MGAKPSGQSAAGAGSEDGSRARADRPAPVGIAGVVGGGGGRRVVGRGGRGAEGARRRLTLPFHPVDRELLRFPLDLNRVERLDLRGPLQLREERLRDQDLVRPGARAESRRRSEEHTSELQSHSDLVCRLLLEKKKKNK